MITRKQFINGERTIEEYYGQFVSESYSNFVGRLLENLLKRKLKADENLKDIPLHIWDGIATPNNLYNKMKEAGDYLTQAGIVCFVKQAVRIYISRNYIVKKEI